MLRYHGSNISGSQQWGALILVSLRDRTAERRGRQNACA